MEATDEKTVRPMIFVGGPRHGEEIAVADTARVYTDLQTATNYYRQEVMLRRNHPILGIPEPHVYKHELFVHADVLNKQESQMLMIQAVFQWWLVYHGETMPLPQILPGTEPNGRGSSDGQGKQR